MLLNKDLNRDFSPVIVFGYYANTPETDNILVVSANLINKFSIIYYYHFNKNGQKCGSFRSWRSTISSSYDSLDNFPTSRWYFAIFSVFVSVFSLFCISPITSLFFKITEMYKSTSNFFSLILSIHKNKMS